MKLTIHNFKSIRQLYQFEIKPFTVISGVNSSGKSSFIQFLLLLKQTVELNAINKSLYLDGYWYKARDYKDLVHEKNIDNQLEVSFLFNKMDFAFIENPQIINLHNVLDDYNCKLTVKYNFRSGEVIIDEFAVVFSFPNYERPDEFIKFKKNSGEASYTVETKKPYFAERLWNEKPQVTNVEYASIFPLFYEGNKAIVQDKLGVDDTPQTEYEYLKEFVKIDDVKILIQNFFEKFSYIGPIREKPKDEYTISDGHKTVGKEGEFVARILEESASKPTQFHKIIKHENGITYQEETSNLTEAVKYWMCDVFDVAEDIYAEKTNDSYRIILTNKSGLKTSIKHVGFGISQLLPIVVEGLRMPENGTFTIEQPEVHLHPKVQSLLFDFLYSLTLQGKTVIVETHSSHFITRMRRRVAEDMSSEMDDRIGLTFIENNNFRTIQLDDYGTLEYFPKDFIEPSSEELRAIVKAQMNKRTQNRS